LIFEDFGYGLNNPDKLYKWYEAVKYGYESWQYREILEHFTSDSRCKEFFNSTTMTGIAGHKYYLWELVEEFKVKVAKNIYNKSDLTNEEQLITDQWGNRSMTKNKNIPLVDPDQ